jgi:hypothetical protein
MRREKFDGCTFIVLGKRWWCKHSLLPRFVRKWLELRDGMRRLTWH